MATHGTLETIFVMVVPLVFWFLVIANLPAIIGGILGLALGIVTFPFLIAYLAFRDRHIFRENRKKSQNQKADSQQHKPQEEYKPPPNKHAELYRLLGVRFNATKAEIRSAFKNKMRMNHPDKLANLDPELQKIATERTIAIKDAYERLTS